MSEQPPPSPAAAPHPAAPTPSPSPPPTSAAPPRPSEVPLTGFRSALEHTGLPRSVLTYKPRLPSRNWSIFIGLVASVTYAYTYDRRECARIKAEYIAKVEARAKEPMKGSLEMPRKVEVLASRWPEDDDSERGVTYFKRYIKPYFVAAAIDYEPLSSPLYGSITRQLHARILSKRRQKLGLEQAPIPMSLPGILSPDQAEQREVDGGIVIVGRASLKEYLEGLRRGWEGGVSPWKWEDDVEKRLESDGVFAKPQEDQPVVTLEDPASPSPELPVTATTDPASTPASASASASASTSASASAASSPAAPSASVFSFLSRPKSPPPPPVSLSDAASTPGQQPQQAIPPHLHVPPSPLPPQAPILLVPFTNHMGFLQVPWMLYDFFTERHRVRLGAEAALKLIDGHTRALDASDAEFDRQAEGWYKSSFKKLPERIQQARKDYLAALEPRIAEARRFASGEREMTEAEKKAGKVTTERELVEERKAKELRWMGNEEGYEIVRPDKEASWSDKFKGWLRVYDDAADAEVSAHIPSVLR